MLFLTYLLLSRIYNMAREGSRQSCSSLLANETGEFSASSWTNNKQGVYSTIETLIGDRIDVYNVQFLIKTSSIIALYKNLS